MLRYGHRLSTALRVQPSQPPTHLRSLARLSGLRAYGTASSPTHEVAVLGGGITGLAAAYYLTKELPKARITIYEASDRIGGWLSSKRAPVHDGDVLFEAGPRSLRPNQNGVLAARLIQELGLAKDTIFTQRTSPAAITRFLYYPDHLVRMPHPAFGFWENFRNVWSEPVFEGSLWAAATEALIVARDPNVQDESIGDFFSRRLSKKTVERALSGVIHGIYAGDVWQLSAKSLFPTPWRDELKARSITAGMLKSRAEGLEITKPDAEFLQEMKSYTFEPLLRETLKMTSVFTFRDGLGMLVDKLARRLFESGNVGFKTSAPVQSITLSNNGSTVQLDVQGGEEPRDYTHVVSALSPTHLNAATGASGLVPPVPYVAVMTVNLYYKQPDMHPPGFGYLIPQATPFDQNPERALGVVFDTAYSPSSTDVDPSSWHTSDMDALRLQREEGRQINVNDFAWYNFPEKPVIQDNVSRRGTKMTVMLGGHWWNGWPVFPDQDEGLALARSVVDRQLGIKQDPEAWQVNLQKDCIPQYTVGHEQRLRTAHNNIWRQYKGRLRVAGNWMAGVGVNDCLRSAFDVARSLGRGRDGTGLEHVGTEEFVRLKPVRKGE